DTPTFGSSSTPSFSSGSSPAFGQSTPAFASSPFGTTTIGAQSSFGPRSSALVFGQSTFGAQRGGSRVVSYTPTIDADGSIGTQPAEKLESISALPVYKDKSHEELRWEDYQLGDKVGLQPTAQPSGGICFGVSTAPTSPCVPATTPAFATGLNFSSSQASPLFNSTPAIGQVTSTFGQNTGSFDQTSILNTPSTGFCGNMFSSPLLLAPANNPAAFGPATASRSGNLYYHSSFLSYL
ncbi:hypothetical protein Goari_007542, partial [Gossypium aridum]|nr:hypothetical protein [Gossypium aridum]